MNIQSIIEREVEKFKSQFRYTEEGQWFNKVNVFDEEDNKVGENFNAWAVPNSLETFLRNSLIQSITEALEARDKQFLAILEDNRKETMWANKSDQEISDQGITDFIGAVKLKMNNIKELLG